MSDKAIYLAIATPRPWEILHGWSTEKYEANVTQADNAPLRPGHRLSNVAHAFRENDAALIVAAVNEYEALLDVAEAARDFHQQALARFSNPESLIVDRLAEKLAYLDGIRSEA